MFVWFIWYVSFSFSVVPCLRVVSSVSLPSHPYHGTSAWFHCSWYSLLEGWKTFSPTWWGPQSPRSPYPISQPGGVWEGEISLRDEWNRSHTNELKHKYMTILKHAFMHPSLKHVCTLFSPSLSSLTLCPLLTDKTSHPSSINFLSYH